MINKRNEATGLAPKPLPNHRVRRQSQDPSGMLASIVNSSFDAIIGKDLRGIVTSWNASAERIFGFAASEMIGRSITEIIPQDLRAEEDRILAQIAQGETVEPFDTVRVTKGGGLIDVSLTISPIRDRAGRITGASKILRDITENRKTAFALREKEKLLHAADHRLAQIVHDMAEGCFAIDRNWQITFANARVARELGEDREHIIGRLFWEVYPWLVGSPTETHYRHVMNERLPVSFEHFSELSQRWKEIRLFPTEEGIAAFVLDVHDRSLAEAAVRVSEERFRAYVEQASDSVFVHDLSGRLVEVNRQACASLGYSRSELLQMSMFEVDLSIDRNESPCAWEHVNPSEAHTVEGRHCRKDGTIFPVEVRFGCFDLEGDRLYLGIARDTSERKQAEETIQKLNASLEQRVIDRTAELEEVNKELESFTFSVSHDLRAPLRNIDGYSQILLEDYGSLLPEDGVRTVNSIRRGARRLGTLIDDLLTFSKLGRSQVHKETLNTDRLVESVLAELGAQHQGRQIEWRVGHLPPCQCDPGLIRQVWFNLISNALKYTQKRDIAVVEIGCDQQSGENVYYVRDNGAGFDTSYADKMFDPFVRLHGAEEFEGSGVGLAIVQRVIHRHGGRVWAESTVGSGATFFFTIGIEPAPSMQ